jgi:predicted RNase H-like nuclease (RuvC/YqgF family)
VAKEAGRDPSALRKNRYPALIAEIQRWLETNRPQAPVSQRQTLLSQRKRNRSLKERIEDMKAQRDSLASLLVEADAKILELTLENARLRALAQVPASKVTPIHQGSSAAA